jgi:hypothetical protein
MSEQQLLGIDANRYAIRAVVTGESTEILHAVEAKPHERRQLVEFTRFSVRENPSTRIVGSPFDDWPDGLLTEVEQAAGPVCWLPPTLVRGTTAPGASWQRQRRLQRARFYTWLHRRQGEDCYWSSLELVLAWEEFLAFESCTLIAHERDKHGLSPSTTLDRKDCSHA